MKLLFKQRFFSWFDSYDIYDEAGNTVYTVEGKLAWGHCLHILDAAGNHIGTVQQKVLTFLPKFELYEHDQCIGCIQKEQRLAGAGQLHGVGLPGDGVLRRAGGHRYQGAVPLDGYLRH